MLLLAALATTWSALSAGLADIVPALVGRWAVRTSRVIVFALCELPTYPLWYRQHKVRWLGAGVNWLVVGGHESKGLSHRDDGTGEGKKVMEPVGEWLISILPLPAS